MAEYSQKDDEALKKLLSHSPAEVLGMLMADIRRPTFSIENCAEMLLKEELSPEIKTRVLEIIKGNSQGIIRIVMLAWDYLELHEGMPNRYKDE